MVPARLGAWSALAAGALLPGAALAYIGPGPGITLLGALVAVGAAVLVAVGGVVLWPLRAYLRRRRARRSPVEARGEDAGTPVDAGIDRSGGAE
jgi:hypothetical protein